MIPQSKRKPWIALLLVVVASPVAAMLYLGCGRRALVYLSLAVLGYPAIVLLSGFGFWPGSIPWTLPVYGFWIAGAIDTLRIAGSLDGEFAGQWYSRWYGLTAVLLIVTAITFIVRVFLIESFRIPSQAMLPMLLVGDHILVGKYQYGLRLPLTGVKVMDIGRPARGDVMVFRYPEDPSLDYVKRVIGLPGDTIQYRQKRLHVNGEGIATEPSGDYGYRGSLVDFVSARRFREKLGDRAHEILIQPEAPNVHLGGVRQFPFRENCSYDETGFSCAVPQRHYFVMGDNRDASSDSRYWGFVPEENILGKVIFVWGRGETIGTSRP